MTPNLDISHPSATGAFFRGFGSSALASSIMMGLLFGLGLVGAMIPPVAGFAAAFTGAHFLASAAFSTLAISLFGGIMGAKRAMFDEKDASVKHTSTAIPVPIQGLASPTIAPVIMPDNASPTPDRRWSDQFAAQGSSQTRIQQILDSKHLSDKTRAEAILASREASAIEPNASRG